MVQPGEASMRLQDTSLRNHHSNARRASSARRASTADSGSRTDHLPSGTSPLFVLSRVMRQPDRSSPQVRWSHPRPPRRATGTRSCG
jgi:hypothetical protein